MNDLTDLMVEMGKSIQEEFNSRRMELSLGSNAGMGADGTPTKEADKVAEDIFIETVRSNDLPFNIISEEIGYIDRGYSKNLVVDPVDGTTNLIAGIPLYAISVAVMKEDLRSAEYGFIMNLSNGNYYASSRGHGVSINGVPVSSKGRRTGICMLSSAGYLDPASSKIVARCSKVRDLGCTSLEMALVATGAADVVCHTGRTKGVRNVDIAAGALMIWESGGEVLDHAGSKLNMGPSPSERKHMIAFRDHEILEGLF
ncbi:MAG: hypothetical protein M1533_04830 [Candidatus Thermoplasmatota archaeon]|jgi:fructose-1,6-bisphosphatase/inositol monophosphatase family enzyme|nr:hypothetical protein [Candidatus Thermoplasmatota archaeon]MCL5794157.1 hypothetical protein [Candidatus Thermoplasmatota archaeon]